jgi:membrane protein DedA with SNARE-associated domain
MLACSRMNIDPAILTLFSGIIGVLVGAALSAWLTYGFQKRLLRQQLDYLKQQAEADAALREKIHGEIITALHEIRHQIHNGFELARLHPPK